MRYFLLSMLLTLSVCGISQTSLQGTLTDADSGESIIYGTVALYQNGVLITGTETDFDGYYSITELAPGMYDVVFSYTGYAETKITGVTVNAGKANLLKAKLMQGHAGHYYGGCGPQIPLIKQDDTTQGFSFQKEDLRRMPHRW